MIANETSVHKIGSIGVYMLYRLIDSCRHHKAQSTVDTKLTMIIDMYI
jgi:hypothetical protein